jgi:hypothetical protein
VSTPAIIDSIEGVDLLAPEQAEDDWGLARAE